MASRDVTEPLRHDPACRLPVKDMDALPLRRRGRTGLPGRGLAVIGSIAFHAAVLALLAWRIAGDGARPVDGIVARMVLPAGSLLPAPEGNGPLPPRQVSAGGRFLPLGCRGAVYTGIGARVNGAGFVIDLAPGGPAERAGLRPGDAILNLEDLPIDVYPAGQPVGVRLLRDGLETAAIVRIAAICNEPPATVA